MLDTTDLYLYIIIRAIFTCFKADAHVQSCDPYNRVISLQITETCKPLKSLVPEVHKSLFRIQHLAVKNHALHSYKL